MSRQPDLSVTLDPAPQAPAHAAIARDVNGRAHDAAAAPNLDGFEGALQRAVEWLRRDQRPEGFWVGRLQSNSCMEAEWILCQHVLGVPEDEKYRKVVRCIERERCADGSWSVYHGAGGDINTTGEAYTALRCAGVDKNAPEMRKTRDWILAHGGLSEVRNFTKYWLALIGEWPWDSVPTLPPELIFIPKWAPFNIYRFASWARGTMLPLCVLSARRLVRRLPPERRLDELFPQGRESFDYNLKRRKGWMSWDGFFFAADHALRWYQKYMPVKPTRELAISACLEWIIRHQEADGAWSGIQPPWIYSLMALHCEGYAMSHPVLKAGLTAFDSHWRVDEDDAVFLQASESPVWDTVLSCYALLDCGETAETSPQLARAAQWTLREQITTWGDWQQFVKGVPSGGWAFEFENDAYPDVDDTAVALIVLQKMRRQLNGHAPAGIEAAIDLGLQWMLGMQCKNGGWAAFDRDNDTKLLTKIPFADFGELLDPPSVDVTAHVLEALAESGRGPGDPAVSRGLAFIRDEQEDGGSWFGRWGVNHIYGTAAVLPAFEALGLDMRQPWIRRASDWIAAKQNADGGWGETCASYMDKNLRGVGPSTASQTGWALMALLAVGGHDYDAAIRRGLDWLVRTQREDGTWDEPEYTGTGFPGYGVGERIQIAAETSAYLQQTTDLQRSFMINYHLYRHYFPLMAMGRARRHFSA